MKTKVTMKNIEARRQYAKENITYSERRLDLLLISISGAGIYVCLEAVRLLNESGKEPHLLIWMSSIAFLSAIFTNFVGQFVSRKCNYYDYLMCDTMIDSGENPSQDDLDEIDLYDKKSEKLDKRATWINRVCTVLMLLGLLLIVYYFLRYF